MTDYLATIDDVTFVTTAYARFAYPSSGQIVALLSDGTPGGGNAVLQQSALTVRTATIAGILESSDEVDVIRDLSESKDEVLFVDEFGDSYTVIVWEFSSSARGAGLWELQVTLVESPGAGS